jgi:diaminopimelate epimerase
MSITPTPAPAHGHAREGRQMRFEKWQALGNDYLILERDELAFELTPPRIRRLCEGHVGVFADGVLLLSRPEDREHVADLRIFNPDGSEAELSGNGAREAILYLRQRGWTDQDSFSIQTVAGPIRPTVTGPHTCRVDMGHARLTSKDFPAGPPDGAGELIAAGPPQGPGHEPAGEAGPSRAAQDTPHPRTWRFRHVSIGNPQCAIAVSDPDTLAGLDLRALGPSIEGHPEFPNRTNVSWYAELQPGPPARIRARIFERGVGETLSSGTGATGAAVAYVLDRAGGPDAGSAGPGRVTVVLDGGELEVEVGEDLHVHLSGWALPVFEGRLSDEFLDELAQAGERA